MKPFLASPPGPIESLAAAPLLGADAPWPDGVHAAFSTRRGGVSSPPFDSFNLGDHVGDAAADVGANRALLRERLGARAVFLRQVHGVEVAPLDADSADGIEADACWSAARGVACTAMVADCLPLLFAAPDGSSVAAAHAGWRGLLGTHGRGVLESLCEAWPAARDAEQRERIVVWLGPCIGPRAFEVGAEVRRAYCEDDAAAAAAFTPLGAGRYLADLPRLARDRLRRLGFAPPRGNDGSAAWCTVANASAFFSHRRDAARLGSTGRMAACIWRR